VRPFSEFSSKLQGFLSSVQGSLSGSAGSSGSTGSTGSTSSTSSAGSSAQVQKYGQCLQNAGNDLAKAQKCASLINK
jgi:hypothetical protein